MRLMQKLPLAAAAAASLALPAAAHAQSSGPQWSGEVRAHADPRWSNDAGPLAEADALAPGLAPAQAGSGIAEVELRGHGHGLSADALLHHERFAGGHTETQARFNELYASGSLPGDAWQFSAGKKIVSWDVGYGWRPNDVVQQEVRRQLVTVTPEGRPLLEFEHFSAETAWTVVWANPQHLNTAFDRRTGAEESALAMRVYTRQGAADWHGFARWGEHTHGSVGAALAWVANESWELHGSWRFSQKHDGWQYGGPVAPSSPATSDPWQTATLGAASQWLAGFTWTNAEQISVLGELWHDGAALADSAWDSWQHRVGSLAAAGGAAPLPLKRLYAANIAWQATPWTNSPNLRRDNAFLRLSWVHEAWTPALDLLYTPKDGGRTVTASLAWQGDRVHLEGGLRVYGGPAGALLAQTPLRRAGYLLASYAF
jgi:hypothetical protein